jgi:hypothetical protein
MSFVPAGKKIVVVLLTCALWGCGSTHHFVPNRPLPKGEWEFSAVVHCDLNGMTVPTLIPDVNFYGGLGNDYDIGVGLQFPFLVTHVSAIRYFDAKADDRWAAYLHVNNLFAFNQNPQFETGGVYFQNSWNVWQSFSVGVGLGYRPYGADYFSNFRLKRYLLGDGRLRLFPSLKYAVSGKHLGISYVHHFGLTRYALRDLYGESVPPVPALTVLRDSVRAILGPSHAPYQNADSIWFLLVDGDTIKVLQTEIPWQCGGIGIPPPTPLKEAWLGTHGFSRSFAVYRDGEWLYNTNLGLSRLRRDFEKDGVVSIVPYPMALRRKLDAVTTWKADHSFGVVYRDRIRD